MHLVLHGKTLKNSYLKNGGKKLSKKYINITWLITYLSAIKNWGSFVTVRIMFIHICMADWVGLSKLNTCRDILPDVGLVYNWLENWIKSGKYLEIKGQFYTHSSLNESICKEFYLLKFEIFE